MVKKGLITKTWGAQKKHQQWAAKNAPPSFGHSGYYLLRINT